MNSGQTSGGRGLDLNVEPVWLQGITGSGVVVSVVDDGELLLHVCIRECVEIVRCIPPLAYGICVPILATTTLSPLAIR